VANASHSSPWPLSFTCTLLGHRSNLNRPENVFVTPAGLSLADVPIKIYSFIPHSSTEAVR